MPSSLKSRGVTDRAIVRIDPEIGQLYAIDYPVLRLPGSSIIKRIESRLWWLLLLNSNLTSDERKQRSYLDQLLSFDLMKLKTYFYHINLG